MPHNHVQFHSSKGKRRILVVASEKEDQQILINGLQDSYEIICIDNGKDALKLLEEQSKTLGLIILVPDLPDITGMEFLRTVRSNRMLTTIPILVIGDSPEMELDYLEMDIADYICKPFPVAGVIRGRVLRAIELFEMRDAIRWTETDPLTGLYTREYFYRYGQQYDSFHEDLAMDSVVIDVSHFHLINDQYGREAGDRMLQKIGNILKEEAEKFDGLASRRSADIFLLYSPHRDDYSDLLSKLSEAVKVGGVSRVHIRMGVCFRVDKSIDIEQRFVRAKMAADTVRSKYNSEIGIYDHSLYEQEILSVQLLEGFHDAIREKQFEVYYQPKYDIRSDTPVLDSAEALVRWHHPELGMISPADFIPLFEKHGLIMELDKYVWNEAAAQVRIWKDQYGSCAPVSVNVSRIDIYDPELTEYLLELLRRYDLTPDDFYLEITESAYSRDSEQIVENVRKMREAGFLIEMDDFGSGYSSLNMITTLPIDVLKLDIQFIRSAFREQKDTRMIRAAIGIAESLHVPTIAEGVETLDQLEGLKELGCDIVQGYYFSRPVPSREYEEYLKNWKNTL